MKSLLRGEKIRENIPVQTKFGNCVLYFTNFVVTLESITKGLVLELDYESILIFQPVEKKSLRLVWSENNSFYDLIINYEKPEDITNKFKEIQNEHMDSLRIAGVITKERVTKQSPKRLTPFSEYIKQSHNDEKIIKAFEVKKSIHGKGALYITDYGVYFESQKHGTVVKIDFEWIKSYDAIKKDTFQIVWSTQNNERFSYEVKVDSAKEIVKIYKDTNNEYAKSMTEIQALKSKHMISD